MAQAQEWQFNGVVQPAAKRVCWFHRLLFDPIDQAAHKVGFSAAVIEKELHRTNP